MIYFISDMHLGHKRIQEFQPNRPRGTVEDHDNWVINNINNTCDQDDTLYAVGDNALGDKSRWSGLFSRIVPRLVFIIGNHDPQFPANKPSYIEKYSKFYEEYEVLGLEHELMIGGQKFKLSHFPYDGDHSREDRFNEYRPEDDGTPLIHGHTHGDYKTSLSKRGTFQIHVGVDAWSRPVSEEEIKMLYLMMYHKEVDHGNEDEL